MHNGRGAGDTETGAYTLNGSIAGRAVPANAGARFHIPTTNEWYKAAYYSPSLNRGKGGYYVFPTQHDATPGSVPSNNIKKRNSPNQANYFNGGFAVTQTTAPSVSQNYLTDVGAFSKSASYYGTFDQAGNVYEWNDDQGTNAQRSLRGSYWVSNVADTSYLDAYILPPGYESSGSGFRLASRQQTPANQNSSNPFADPIIGHPYTSNHRFSSRRDNLTNFAKSNRRWLIRAADSSSRFHTSTSIAEAFQHAPLFGGHIATGHDIFGNNDLLNMLASETPMITSMMSSTWHR